MRTDSQSLVLFVAGCAFLLYLLFKLLFPAGGRSGRAAHARRKIAAAKRRARNRTLPPLERAEALREAAIVALEDLQRPELAASYARRAERLHPEDTEATSLIVQALRQTTRYRALERILWRRLARDEQSVESFEQAFSELVGLYEGPLRREEIAKVLRGLREGTLGRS